MALNGVFANKKVVAAIIFAVIIFAVAIAVPAAVIVSQHNEVNEYFGSTVLDEVPLIDGHNDLPYNIYKLERNRLKGFNLDSDLKKHPVWGNTASSHTDLPRLRKGKVGGQFWVAYVSCETQYKDAVERTMEQIDVIKRMIKKYPKDMKLVTTSDGIMEAFKEKKIASLICVEGGHSMDSRLSILRIYYELGVRYMTLTHSCNTPWADASPIDDPATVNPVFRNITEWGKNVIWEMNRLGMMVDISHVSFGVMNDVLEHSKAPVIFSHSSAHAVNNHHRNVQDDVLRGLIKNKGVVMINFYPDFIGGNTIDDVVGHINHVRSITGANHIGIGGDYDGVGKSPIGLEDVSKYPDLFDMLFNGVLSNGTTFEAWSREDLKKLAGLNTLRVMKDVEKVRDSLIAEEPYEDLIPYDDLVAEDPQKCMSDLDIHKE